MPQYLVAGYLPDNYVPSLEDAAMSETIHALNREMVAAGVRIFAFAVSPPPTQKYCGRSPMAGPHHQRAIP